MANLADAHFGLFVNNRLALISERYGLDDMIRSAELAEEAGFEFVAVGDSILAKPRFAPLTVLAYIAARTQRVRLATGILRPHMRRPLPLAQEWSTLDRLSDGRTVLGVGIGAGPADVLRREHDLAGIPKEARGAAFEEWVEVLRCLWREPEVTYVGKHVRVEGAAVGIEPVQRPHPPIVIAAGSYVPTTAGTGPDDNRRAGRVGRFGGPLDRVARLGDGWLTGIVTPDEYAEGLRFIRERAWEAHGRRLGEDFRATLNCYVNVDPDAGRARRAAQASIAAFHGRGLDDETFERWTLCGPPDAIGERVTAYVEAGVRYFQFIIADEDQHTQLERLQALGAELGVTAPPTGKATG